MSRGNFKKYEFFYFGLFGHETGVIHAGGMQLSGPGETHAGQLLVGVEGKLPGFFRIQIRVGRAQITGEQMAVAGRSGNDEPSLCLRGIKNRLDFNAAEQTEIIRLIFILVRITWMCWQMVSGRNISRKNQLCFHA